MAVIFTVSRCSPLSPSTDKYSPINKISSAINNSQTTEDEKIKELIQADDPINSSLKEIDNRNAEFSTTSEFDAKFSNTQNAQVFNVAASDFISDAITPAANTTALAVVKSSEFEKDLLKEKDGKVRINVVFDANLSQTIHAKISSKSLVATSYLLYSDANTLATYNGIELKLKIAIAKSGDNKFVIEIRRDPSDARRDEISSTLFHHAIHDASSLAIVLQ